TLHRYPDSSPAVRGSSQLCAAAACCSSPLLPSAEPQSYSSSAPSDGPAGGDTAACAAVRESPSRPCDIPAENHTQTVANLAGIDAIVLLLCGRDGPQHQRMGHFQPCGMRSQVIVDPTGEDGRFHRCRPRLWQHFHPLIEMKARGGNRTFGVNRAAHVLQAVADRSLMYIQADVIHRLHGGASFGVSESARSLSSAFVHQALLLHRPIHSNYTSSCGSFGTDSDEIE